MSTDTSITKTSGLSLHQERVLLSLGNELARGEHRSLVLIVNERGDLIEINSGVRVKAEKRKRKGVGKR